MIYEEDSYKNSTIEADEQRQIGILIGDIPSMGTLQHSDGQKFDNATNTWLTTKCDLTGQIYIDLENEKSWPRWHGISKL